MSQMVQLTVAGDPTEAEELQTMLQAAGIECEIEQAVEHHPSGLENAPQRVLVRESDLEAAQNAIEAISDPDDFFDEE
jgi:hypothetical protein